MPEESKSENTPVTTPQETPSPAGEAEQQVNEAPPTAEMADFADTPDQSQFVQALEQIGFKDLSDESDAQSRLLDAFKQEQQRREQLEYTLERQAYEARTAQSQGNAPQNNETPPSQERHPWDIPNIDLMSVQKYRDTDGWKPETPAEIRSDFERYQAAAEHWAHGIAYRPKETLIPLVEQLVQERIKEELTSFTQKSTAQQTWDRFHQDNASWLYAQDPVTKQPMMDHRAGALALSPLGIKFNEHVRDAAEMGVKDPDKQIQYARALLSGNGFQADIQSPPEEPPKPTQTPEQVADEKTQAFLDRQRGQATSTPNRAGSFPRNDVDGPQRPQNPSDSLGRRFAKAAIADGAFAEHLLG